MQSFFINIKNHDDFKLNFGDRFCDLNKNIKQEHVGNNFVFVIEFSDYICDILKGYNAINFKYGNIINISLEIKIIINVPNDYAKFYDNFIEWTSNNTCIIKREYNETCFIFSIEYPSERKVNELLIHNFLLIKNTFPKNNIKLNILKKYRNSDSNQQVRDENSDRGRINTYTAEHISSIQEHISFNGKQLNWHTSSISKLFPAIYIDSQTLKFLSSTISGELWKHIIGYKKICESTFKKNTLEQKHWFILRACQNYLFDNFDNVSYAYTVLRRLAYSNAKFYEEHIKNVPLIAVIIFSQYDYFFRNYMLNIYKNKGKVTQFTCCDFLLDLQERQSVKNYLAHTNLLREGYDIKTVVKYCLDSTILLNNISSADFYKELLHCTAAKTIRSKINEIFNSVCQSALTQGIDEKLINDLKLKVTNTLSDNIFMFIYYLYISTNINSDFDDINYSYICDDFFQYFANKIISSVSIRLKNKNDKISDNAIAKKIKDIFKTKGTDALITMLKQIVLTEKETKILNTYAKRLKVHDDIIAELFEATTLAEGLLQLTENAVVHSNGGLLTLRIRDFDDLDDKKYLKEHEYKDYFEQVRPTAKFYLEIILSDISKLTFKEKFLANVENRCLEIPQLAEWHEKYSNTFSNMHIYKDFFAPSKEVEEAWEKYYKTSENHVHHYGLQIFESVITSKTGLFAVSGHHDYYVNENSFKVNDSRDIPGTSYQILLPINHNHTEDQNIVNDKHFDQTMKYSEMEMYQNGSSNTINTILVPLKDIQNIIESNYDRIAKEDIIKLVSNKISTIIEKEHHKYKRYLLLVNYGELINTSNYVVELIIKSLLLYLFNKDNSEFIPPVAIINMSSHMLLETSRIIALFYNKQGASTEKMSQVQIYLNGKNIGEEILFKGDNLNQNAQRMRKNAMTRGLMFDYWHVAQILLQRSTHCPIITPIDIKYKLQKERLIDEQERN